MKKAVFEYYHGNEAEAYSFYRIPKVLFTHDYFRFLSSDAKILYGLMLDRMGLSIKNGWFDEYDRVYIIFTLDDVVETMNCGKDKAVKILAELDADKGIGLIERVRRGQGKPSVIYLRNFLRMADGEDSKGEESFDVEEPDGRSQDFGKSEVKTSENQKSRLRKIRSQDFGKSEVKTSENQKSRLRENRSQDFGKSEVKTSENQKCRLRKIRSADFGKTDTNNTEYNKTDDSKTESIYPSSDPDGMDRIQIYRDIVKANIEYEILTADADQSDREYIDEIVDLITETVSIERGAINIAGTEYPYQLVKGKLLKLNMEHIRYVLSCLAQNTTKVRNVKAYLLTCLFNAPSTMASYYRAEVNHDFGYPDNYPDKKILTNMGDTFASQ